LVNKYRDGKQNQTQRSTAGATLAVQPELHFPSLAPHDIHAYPYATVVFSGTPTAGDVKWEQRERLKGRLSGALWLRHLAELIRRGFEDAFDERWPEEYEGAGHWPEGVKERIFGAGSANSAESAGFSYA